MCKCTQCIVCERERKRERGTEKVGGCTSASEGAVDVLTKAGAVVQRDCVSECVCLCMCVRACV